MPLQLSSKISKTFFLETMAWARFVERSALRRIPALLLGVVSLLLMSATIGRAQSIQYTENKPDQALRSAMRVDPSTLGLSIEVPIASYPGRGGASMPINLSYSSKQWRVDFSSSYLTVLELPRTTSYPKFSEWATTGWTTTADIPRIEWVGAGQPFSSDGTAYVGYDGPNYINRIRVHMPGGSSHELRIDDSPVTTPATAGTFYAVDGSNLRYEATSSTDGILYLPDGARYQLLPSSSGYHYIDRNGNALSYNATNRQWTDYQSRVFDVPLPATPSATPYTYNLPSTTSTPVSYTVRWSKLEDALTIANDPLRYVSNMTPSGPGDSFTLRSPALFDGSDPNRLYGEVDKFNPMVLAEITLPNGQHYLFTYNVWAEITKVVYPTGAYERFDHAAIAGVGYLPAPYGQANRGVVDRWLSPSGNGGDELHWHYAAAASSNVLTISTTAPDESLTERLMSAETSEQSAYFGFSNPGLGTSFEDRLKTPSGTMLRRTLTEWALAVGPTGMPRNPRITKKVNILLDTGTGNTNALTSTTTMFYDDDLNIIATNDYDFTSISKSSAETLPIGSISAPQYPVRTMEATYLVNDTSVNSTLRSSYRTRNLLGLPTSTRIKNSAGTIVAKTKTRYDDYNEGGTAQENLYPLWIYSGTIGGWVDPGNLRGLPTTSSVWLNTTDSYLTTHAQYDQFGNVIKSKDANGNVSEITFSAGYSYAYPTTATTAVPDPTGAAGSTTALSTNAAYHAATGLMTSVTDVNGQTTSYAYDAINRLTTITRPSGGGATSYDYGDTPGNLYVRTQTSLDSTRVIETYQYYDKLGRGCRTFVNEGSTYLTTDTKYDSMSRPSQVSRPYRTSSLTAAVNPDNAWTTNGYDFLGRTTSVTTADGAVVNTEYSASTSATLGTVVTVTDQAGKLNRSLIDVLGRLARADEPDTSSSIGSLGTLASPQQATSYSYDLMGNMLEVTQGSQTRTFVYNSLSRLLSATNPESGAISYTYDSNGNLLTRTDGRLVVATYAYDALNRNKSVVYSNDPAATPTINRYYDGWRGGSFTNIPNVKGSIWQTETSGVNGSRTTINSYDELGRPLSESQQFNTAGGWSQSYTVQRAAYSLGGGVTTQTYPSQRSVTYNYDAAGRVGDKDTGNLAFRGNLGGGTTRTYSRGIAYTPFGSLAREQFGTDAPVYNKLFYNSRGQLAEIRESTSSATDTSWELGAIINHYSNNYSCWGAACVAPDNNGNLMKQEIHIQGQTMKWQQYDYDSLNRLKSARETLNGGSAQWQQKFVYDRYGNRTIDTNVAETFGGVNNLGFEVHTAKNRLYAPGDLAISDVTQRRMQYDDGGNLKRDTYTGAGDRTYDAENRMIKAWGGSSQWQEYTYNADGKRVRRKVNGVETWQVYGMDGELLAEYAANANPSTPQKEFGYRNGQLLITATTTAGGWGAEPTLHDNPLTVGTTTVQSRHITELRTAIDGVRTHLGMAAYSWQYAQVTVGDLIKADPIVEMRTALDQALGAPSPAYATGLGQGQPIKAIHIQELRDRVLTAWQSGTGAVELRWLVADQLGTPRMIIDNTGNLAGVKRHDYLPFGEEIFAGTSGRTTGMGYTANGEDGVRQKFTSYERDNETGLDYAQARYYASVHGRFISTDPLMASAKPGIPQSWNRYAYCINNPLVYVDPDGLTWYKEKGSGEHGQPIWFDEDPGDKYELFTDFVYYSNHGWVALNPLKNDYREGFLTEDDALHWLDPGQDVSLLDGILEVSSYLGAPGLVRGVFNIGARVGLRFFAREAVEEVVTVTNPVPSTLARVIPGRGPFTQLGRATADDVFVTAADDIAGMNAPQLSQRLGIPNSREFTVFEFSTPRSGLASPINRTNPGFTGFGRTSGQAREFVIPNGPIPANATRRIVTQ
jgi:RHS repeat-associated protein